MSDINAEIIDYLNLEKQVRLDGLQTMDKSAEIPQRLLKEVSIFDRWIEHLANGVTTKDGVLHLQRVSHRTSPEFVIMLKGNYKSKDGKIKECLTAKQGNRDIWIAPANDLP